MRQIAGKYYVDGTIQKIDGAQIPDDEPVMLFRGRDRLVPEVLDFYLFLRRSRHIGEDQLAAFESQVETIKAWQTAHPDRLKWPG